MYFAELRLSVDAGYPCNPSCMFVGEKKHFNVNNAFLKWRKTYFATHPLYHRQKKVDHLFSLWFGGAISLWATRAEFGKQRNEGCMN